MGENGAEKLRWVEPWPREGERSGACVQRGTPRRLLESLSRCGGYGHKANVYLAYEESTSESFCCRVHTPLSTTLSAQCSHPAAHVGLGPVLRSSAISLFRCIWHILRYDIESCQHRRMHVSVLPRAREHGGFKGLDAQTSGEGRGGKVGWISDYLTTLHAVVLIAIGVEGFEI